MKKLTQILAVFAVAGAVVFFSCQKNSDAPLPDDTPIREVTIETSTPGIIIDAKNVYSSKDSLVRRINIVDSVTNDIIDSYIINLVNARANSSDVKTALINKSFKGTASIILDGVTILSHDYNSDKTVRLSTEDAITSVVGKRLLKAKMLMSIGQVSVTQQKVEVPCSVSTVHDCVSYKIEDMNWIDYGACLATAPACYAQLWASCGWDVCHDGKEYTNPV